MEGFGLATYTLEAVLFVPSEDRRLNSAFRTPHSALRVTLGAGREALINDPKIRVESLSGTKLTVRLIAAIELSASRFGKDKLAAGDTVAFSSTLTTHARAYKVEWRGSFKLTK